MSLTKVAGLVIAFSAAGAGAALAQARGAIAATVTVVNTVAAETNIQVARELSAAPSSRADTRRDTDGATITTEQTTYDNGNTRAKKPTVTIVYW